MLNIEVFKNNAILVLALPDRDLNGVNVNGQKNSPSTVKNVIFSLLTVKNAIFLPSTFKNAIFTFNRQKHKIFYKPILAV